MKGCRSIKLFGFGAGRLSLAWGRYLIHMVYTKAVGGLNCTLGIEGLIQKYIRISVNLSLGENRAIKAIRLQGRISLAGSSI